MLGSQGAANSHMNPTGPTGPRTSAVGKLKQRGTKMNNSKAIDQTQGVTSSVGPYTVYAAGGLFTQHELATNVLIKEAVWRLSNGQFQLVLPQSREMRELNRPDVEAYLRNVDLLEVVKADIVVARFDGLELDSGTVVEFTVAKSLGKPAVVLRCDFRRLYGKGLSEPYNLMVKSWPRTVEVHIDSYLTNAGLLAEELEVHGDSVTFQAMMNAELNVVQKGVDEIAKEVIDGLEAVIAMKSPYPPEYQENVYKALRYSPGSGFDQLLTENELDEIIGRLRTNGTL
jgi:nucleoside 2-deoxyribosyltransferase